MKLRGNCEVIARLSMNKVDILGIEYKIINRVEKELNIL